MDLEAAQRKMFRRAIFAPPRRIRNFTYEHSGVTCSTVLLLQLLEVVSFEGVVDSVGSWNRESSYAQGR